MRSPASGGRQINSPSARQLHLNIAWVGLALMLVQPAFGYVLQSQGYGARATGLGQAVTAAGAEGAYGVYYNPAQMVWADNPEFSMDYAQLLMGLSDHSNISQSFLGVSYPWQKFGGPLKAAGFAYTQFDHTLYSERVFYGSYASELRWEFFGGKPSAGAALKRAHRAYETQDSFSRARDASGAITGTADPLFSNGTSKGAWSLDLGFHWKHPKGWSAGLRWADILEPDMALGSTPDRLRRSLALGGAWQNGRFLTLAAELEMKKRLESVEDRRFNFAGEKFFPAASLGIFGFRGGFGFGNRSWRSAFLGTSWRMNALSVEYAFTMPLAIEDIAGNHRVSLTVRFGGASPEEELADLYRSERKARTRAQEDLDSSLDELERLLRFSEMRELQAMAAAAEQIPMKPAPSKPPSAPKAVPPEGFWKAWSLYKERASAGAARVERLEIMRRIVDAYGSWEPAASEWSSLQDALEKDRSEFDSIWRSYQRLALRGAPKPTLIQSLQRIVRRFEGSGLNLAPVQRELDRLRFQ